ncbi:MAG TPA: PTS ascorbate transporter subunit IIC [Anaerolineaceae bacterium]|jgi:PTS system ascorbate-specific IIC component|nr:PTS ascorbate transporter subunit IIC [Anaerolineaceae bacterium]
MAFLTTIWEFIVKNIITQPAYFIGLIVLIGYILLRKPWYDVLAGTIKAIVGYLILAVGSGGLVSNFRPVLVGLKDRFQLDAMVIDPYFGQNAVTAGVEEVFGRTFGQVMFLVLIAFIFNIVLVALKKWTKFRAIFTTGHVQVQQASTAFWLILFCFPALGETPVLLIMALLLGLYWAAGTNMTVEISQDLTDGAGFSIAHQQMFALKLFSWLSEKMSKSSKRESKRLEDMQFPGFLSIFNENMVATSILMTLFFGTILLVLGRDYLIEAKFLAEDKSYFFYILTTCLNFAVYLAILQLGVRTFVGELTQSFQGISHKLLKGAVPGVDCAVSYGFGSPNAVTVGFLFGALGQFLAIAILILLKSPTLVIAGFVPVFFDNATIAVYANNKGGLRAAMLWPFVSGLMQVFGSALIAGWVGLAAYGGYLGMWDWAVVWPVFTVVMKYLSYAGVALVALFLLAIPQVQYLMDKKGYFLVTEDYEAYKALKAEEKA